MPGSWRQRDDSGLRLAVRVQPRAGADRGAGLSGASRASVRLLRGSKSRDNLLAVGGVQQLPAALAGFAATIGPGRA